MGLSKPTGVSEASSTSNSMSLIYRQDRRPRVQALNTFKHTVGDINLETGDSIVTTTYTVCVLTRSQPHTWCVCSQNLIQKIERAAQQKASATHSRLDRPAGRTGHRRENSFPKGTTDNRQGLMEYSHWSSTYG